MKAVAIGLTAALLLGSAASAQQELKLATFVPPGHVIARTVLVPWTEDIAKASDGKLTGKFYPSLQLGGKQDTQYQMMTQGISDVTFTLPGYTSSAFPMTTLTELPGLADSAIEGTNKIWDRFDRFLKADFKDAQVLALWANDNAVLMSKTKRVSKLEDLKGLKVRAPSAVQAAQMEQLGATAVDMPVNQIYNSLDRGVIDIALVPISVVLDFKLGEVARHYTLNIPLGRSPFLVAMNKAKYDGLSPELRAAVDKTAGRALSLKGAKAYEDRGAEALDGVKKDGKSEVVMLPAAERARWQAALRPLIDKIAAEHEKAGVPARAFVASYGVLD